VGAAVTVVGIGQLLISHAISGWGSDVLVNTGTASLLFVPLFIAQRSMEARVRATQEDVDTLARDVMSQQAEVRQSLAELRATFADRDAQSRHDEERDLVEIGENPSCAGVNRALAAARAQRVLGRWGIRVHVVDPQVRVFARLIPSGESDVTVELEKIDGESVSTVVWRPSEAADDLMSRVSAELRKASLHPGQSFDPTLLFRELSQSLKVAISVKDRFTLIDDMSDAQQYVPPQWMIYDWGIGAWHEGTQPYYIDRERLKERDLEEHMLEKTWLDQASFHEALNTALLLERSGRIE